MAYESDEDFTTPPVRKRRKTNLLESERFKETDAVRMKRKGLDRKEAGYGQETGQERERKQNLLLRKDLPLFGNASSLEKKDVLFVLALEMSESERAASSDTGNSTEYMALEMRKREILDMIRKRKKSKKRRDEEIKSIKNMVTGEVEQHWMMMILLALKGKRCCGEPLPTPKELASYVSKRTKGKVTSTVEQANARTILKHIVLSYSIKGGGREALSGILKGVLETEDI